MAIPYLESSTASTNEPYFHGIGEDIGKFLNKTVQGVGNAGVEALSGIASFLTFGIGGKETAPKAEYDDKSVTSSNEEVHIKQSNALERTNAISSDILALARSSICIGNLSCDHTSGEFLGGMSSQMTPLNVVAQRTIEADKQPQMAM